MRFYQASGRSRLVQTVIMTLVASSATLSAFRTHHWTALAVVALAAVQVHSLWHRYWEITPDATLLSRAYGFKLTYPVSTILYAGPVRETAPSPAFKKAIELELDGRLRKCYVRVANTSDFLEELRLVSPQARIVGM